jgi:BirA family biotin operon repressor/biotin-[acetyl-CoA-carboxylase] ligase
MSMVLLAEKIKPFNLSMITPATAVIVCDAIKKIIGLETQIKWVNDILLHGKKICGISAEGVANKGMDSIVVGIGINITTEDFPDDLRTIAASLLPGQKVGEYKNKLLNEILTVFLSTDWNNEKAVCAAYKRRLSMIGSPISVTHGNEKYNATAVDIDDECRLIVKKPNGSLVILSAAEVSVRGIDHE